jgi:hypothetical protein
MKNLDRDEAVHRRLMSSVHRTHASRTNPLDDAKLTGEDLATYILIRLTHSVRGCHRPSPR